MRTRAFVNGAAFGYLYQAIVIVAGLWLTPFLLRHLGQSEYGRWLICLQILSYAMLADFGTVAMLPREIAYASGESDTRIQEAALGRLIGRTTRVVLAQTGLVLAASLVLFSFAPAIPGDFKGPVLLMVAGFAVLFPLRIFPAILEGLQQLRVLGQIRTVVWVVSTVVICASVVLGYRIYSLAFGWIVNQVGYALAAYIYLRRFRTSLVHLKTLRGGPGIRGRDLLRGSWISVGQIAQLLVSGTDLLIVGHVMGPAAVVVYSCTGKLLSVLANQPMILIHTAMPGLSQMKVSESREKLLKVSTAMGQGMLTLGGAVGIIVLCLNDPFVTLWVGARIFGGNSLTLLFVLNMVVRQMDMCFAVALFAFGYEKPMAIKALADGIFGLSLALLLSRWFGLNGVVAGLLASAILVSVPVNLYLLARECGVKRIEVLKPYWPWLWRFALFVALSWEISRTGWMNSHFRTATMGGVVALLYTAVMIGFVRKSELWPYIQPLFKRAGKVLALGLAAVGLEP